MSKETALKFREYLKAHPKAEQRARTLLRTYGRVDNVALGQEFGFLFTESDAAAAWQEVLATGQLTAFEREMSSLGSLPGAANDDELSDLELEMVSGGGKYPCNTDDSRFAADNYSRPVDGGRNDP